MGMVRPKVAIVAMFVWLYSKVISLGISAKCAYTYCMLIHAIA